MEDLSTRQRKLCAIDECASTRYARGWCVKHYYRWLRRGSPFVSLNPGRSQTEPERFWAKVERRGPDECWLWQGSLSARGYGHFMSAKQKDVRAHRWAYEHDIGPIPEGLTIDHLCRVRACVNSSHLEAVSSRTNTLRGNGPSARNARKTHCIHGHEFTPENTYRDTKGRACRTCGRHRQRKHRGRARLEAMVS